MARHYESSAALCPFYRGEEATQIFCEGVGGATLRLEFIKSARDYKAKYCRWHWQKCRIARMLTEKEEEEAQCEREFRML